MGFWVRRIRLIDDGSYWNIFNIILVAVGFKIRPESFCYTILVILHLRSPCSVSSVGT